MRPTVKASLLASLIALASGLAACGGVPPDRKSADSGDATDGNARGVLAPAEFEGAIAKPDTVLINVHVPYEGEIRGTDKFVPFDQVRRRRSELPPPTTRIALYCRTGPMSETAARTFARARLPPSC